MRFSSGAILPVSLLASAVSAAHFDVTVGKGGQLKFDPEDIEAKLGDTITYHFFARNHSVIESSFDKPCQPLAEKGIFSTFVPTESPDVASPTTFTIIVEDDKPIWLYCGQTNGNHCQSGMVHSVNAPKQGNTFEAYKALAAKSPPPSGAPAGGPTGGILKTVVQVGLNGTLTYTPNDIKAVPGTIVEFKFNPRNHTVTESSFDKPCVPLDKGFSSGFVATTQVPAAASFLIEVKDTKPIWFYCGQVNGNHCQQGMVGGINAPASGNTVAAFIELAKKAPPPSSIPPKAPLGGLLFVKDTQIKESNLNGGNAIDVDAILAGAGAGGGAAPPPAGNYTPTSTDKYTAAGNYTPTSCSTDKYTPPSTTTLSTDKYIPAGNYTPTLTNKYTPPSTTALSTDKYTPAGNYTPTSCSTDKYAPPSPTTFSTVYGGAKPTETCTDEPSTPSTVSGGAKPTETCTDESTTSSTVSGGAKSTEKYISKPTTLSTVYGGAKPTETCTDEPTTLSTVYGGAKPTETSTDEPTSATPASTTPTSTKGGNNGDDDDTTCDDDNKKPSY